MKNIFFVFIIISLITNSCKNDIINKNFNLVSYDNISLPIPQADVYSANITKHIIENDREYALVYFFPTQYITKYDLVNKKIIEKIAFPKHLYDLYAFEYLSKDSIWLLGSMNNSYADDSSLVLINNKSKILHIANTKTQFTIDSKLSNLINQNNEALEQALDSLLFPSWLAGAYSATNISKDKLLIPFLNDNRGKNHFVKKLPYIAYYDLNKDSIIFNYEINFPDTTKNNFYDNNNYTPLFTLNGKHAYTCFSASPIVNCWNLETQTIKLFNTTSKYIDTILPQQTPLKESSSELYNPPCYSAIQYIPRQELFVRYAFLSQEYNYQKTAIILNTNYQIIDELLVFEDVIDVFNGYISKSTIDGDSLYIKQYLFTEVDKKSEKIKPVNRVSEKNESILNNKQLNNSNIINYLKNENGISNNTFAAIIINKNGCYSCNKEAARFLSKNKEILFSHYKTPLYLFFVNSKESRSNAKRFFKEWNLAELENLIIDTTDIYYNYQNKHSMNPRLISVKNLEIIFDTVYNPNYIGMLPNDLIQCLEP